MSSFALEIHMNVVRLHLAAGNHEKALVRLRMALATANQTHNAMARSHILPLISKMNRVIERERIRAKTEQLRQELAHA